MSITPRKAAVTKVQRCVTTLGGMSVVAGAALTFGLASPAAAQASTAAFTPAVQALPVLATTAPATAAQAPKTDGMPMPMPHHMHPHHMGWHHHDKCDRRHHDHYWHHDHWDLDDNEDS